MELPINDYRIIVRAAVDEELESSAMPSNRHNRSVLLAAMLKNPLLNNSGNLRSAVEEEFEANYGEIK